MVGVLMFLFEFFDDQVPVLLRGGGRGGGGGVCVCDWVQIWGFMVFLLVREGARSHAHARALSLSHSLTHSHLPTNTPDDGVHGVFPGMGGRNFLHTQSSWFAVTG